MAAARSDELVEPGPRGERDQGRRRPRRPPTARGCGSSPTSCATSSGAADGAGGEKDGKAVLLVAARQDLTRDREGRRHREGSRAALGWSGGGKPDLAPRPAAPIRPASIGRWRGSSNSSEPGPSRARVASRWVRCLSTRAASSLGALGPRTREASSLGALGPRSAGELGYSRRVAADAPRDEAHRVGNAGCPLAWPPGSDGWNRSSERRSVHTATRLPAAPATASPFRSQPAGRRRAQKRLRRGDEPRDHPAHTVPRRHSLTSEPGPEDKRFGARRRPAGRPPGRSALARRGHPNLPAVEKNRSGCQAPHSCLARCVAPSPVDRTPRRRAYDGRER